ncbi:MAG: tRNA (5-methylaminomethyl-2-thiouridylate)-methyltransferase, tRNA-specific 2-thiouridylase [Candidatus Nomurabacteria bacterium]|nr:tRNA (5-methylaminomethyl-2-thiouridylate)-methyltransferase, tRNA-specific 2-thiouridylase [Candidatus Nomurabacteria bacterium]
MNNGIRKKVYVGMSGGVDSSVSAALLKEQGYDVTGVFIKVWQPDFIECTWKEDRLDAMRVAGMLEIPFITLDLEKEYKNGVIDYMISEYKAGRTPNPDVMCNKQVKFGAFLDWAKAEGADYIATGHYSQIVQDESGMHLAKSADGNKDQTYFLWTLTSEVLKNVLFPVGGMTKEEVRAYAEKVNLSVSKKKDSQGLCFVGNIDLKTLLKNYIEEKKGDVKNEEGEIIGHHNGAIFYTIGERHGFTITKKTTEDKPYFVIGKDMATNSIIVSSGKRIKSENIIYVEDVHFTKSVKKGEVYEARARYRAPLAKVEVINKNTFKVLDGDLGETPGQSLVLYKESICIGGGIIK